MALFAIAGAMAAVSGILLLSRLGSGNATAASGLEFDVIAAVVVGGTALSGGRGSMLGTLLGVLVITLIGNGLVLLGINPFFQQVVRGLIIVIAVLANIQAIGARRGAQQGVGRDCRRSQQRKSFGPHIHPWGDRARLLVGAGRRPGTASARSLPGDDASALASGCYPLVPFGNRVRDNRFSFRGRDYQLLANTDWDRHYLHGEGWQADWTVEQKTAGSLDLSFDNAANQTTPYSYAASQRFVLLDEGSELTLSVTNKGNTRSRSGWVGIPIFR